MCSGCCCAIGPASLSLLSKCPLISCLSLLLLLPLLSPDPLFSSFLLSFLSTHPLSISPIFCPCLPGYASPPASDPQWIPETENAISCCKLASLLCFRAHTVTCTGLSLTLLLCISLMLSNCEQASLSLSLSLFARTARVSIGNEREREHITAHSAVFSEGLTGKEKGCYATTATAAAVVTDGYRERERADHASALSRRRIAHQCSSVVHCCTSLQQANTHSVRVCVLRVDRRWMSGHTLATRQRFRLRSLASLCCQQVN